ELKRPISTFSGGEKNRLQLAHFMKHAKDLWIFDEPTNDLDLETIGILEEELRNYPGSLIIVGHDRSFIENVTDRCFLIHDQGLEIFEAGFSQAQMFLEALELEKLAQKKSLVNTPIATPTKKIDSKDKKRLEDVQKKIEKNESEVEKLKGKLEAIDYSSEKAMEEAAHTQSSIDKIEA